MSRTLAQLRVPCLATKNSHRPLVLSKDYHQVRFWYANLFEEYTKKLASEMNGLATQQKRYGPCPKSEINEDPYPYLENSDGSAIPQDVLVVVGQKAQRLWQSLYIAGLAPRSWGKASERAHMYFNSEMLSMPEFQFFRYCNGNWKITQWASKAYPSWSHNYFKPGKAVCLYLLYRQYAKDIYILATSNDIDRSPVYNINIPSTNADFLTAINSIVKSIRMLHVTSSLSLAPLQQSHHLLH